MEVITKVQFSQLAPSDWDCSDERFAPGAHCISGVLLQNVRPILNDVFRLLIRKVLTFESFVTPRVDSVFCVQTSK